MQSIIDLVHNNKVVTIVGPAGIGKTSITRNLANYIKDRRKFKDGIIYVELRGWESAQMFLSRLSLWIRSLNKDYTQEYMKSKEKNVIEGIEVLKRHKSAALK